MKEKITAIKIKFINWRMRLTYKIKLWWKNIKIRLVKIFGGFNWKARIKNKMFLAAMVSTVILLLQQLGFGIPIELDSIINSCLSILALLGILSDPTSQGFEDYNSQDLKDEKIQKIERDYNHNGIPDDQEDWFLNQDNELVAYEDGEVVHRIGDPIYNNNINSISQNNFQQPSKLSNQQRNESNVQQNKPNIQQKNKINNQQSNKPNVQQNKPNTQQKNKPSNQQSNKSNNRRNNKYFE